MLAKKEEDGADAESPWGFFSQPSSCSCLVLSRPLERHGSPRYQQGARQLRSAGAGARRGRREDGCSLRQSGEALASSLEDTGLPRFGARSHLLMDAEAHGFLVQDDVQAPPGEAEGGSHPGWAPQAGDHAEEDGEVWWPSSLSTARVPLPRHLTCCLAGIPSRIPMNRELLSPRGQSPSPAITPPALGGRARQAGDTQLSLLQKFNNNRFQ